MSFEFPFNITGKSITALLTGHSFMACTQILVCSFMACTQILVHRWGPTIRIFVFHRWTTLQTEATFSLCELACEKQPLLTTVQIHPEIWTNKLKKNVFFPVIDWFRTLRESCVADQSCRNFFYSCETRAIWRQTWWLLLLVNRDELRPCTIENWTLFGRGYFWHDSSQRKIAPARSVQMDLTRSLVPYVVQATLTVSLVSYKVWFGLPDFIQGL